MNNKIYLDNNATTKVDEEVFDAMLPYLREEYGNPSSSYNFGKKIKKEIEKARESVAKLINANSDEIIFTSCATESNNAAIMSAIRSFPNKKHLITTKVEHASIMETMKYLESIGYYVTYLSVDKDGNLDLDELKDSISSDTLLVSIMFANNETGVIFPIEEIGSIVKEKDILFHVDAVQAIGKVDVDVEKCNIDMLSMSGHKLYAPKGVGALYKRRNIPFVPLVFGHQESNMRGGTENVAYIVGFGKACEIALSKHNVKELCDYLKLELMSKFNDIVIYGDENSKLDNTINVAFAGINGEELLIMLEQQNIFVSTGSACNSTSIDHSHVLVAMNADLDKYSPIRISLGKYNNKDDVDFVIIRLEKIINILKRKNYGG